MTTKKKVSPEEINELGQIKLDIKKLKKSEKTLVDKIKPLMADHEVIETPLFKAELDVSNLRVLDWEGVRKRIGQKKFNEVARITLEELGKYLGKEELDELTVEFKPQRSLSVDPI
jgi:hypothetical protein